MNPPSNVVVWLTNARNVAYVHEEIKGQLYFHYDEFGTLLATETQYPNALEVDEIDMDEVICLKDQCVS